MPQGRAGPRRYEALAEAAPGLGGWLPWTAVNDEGFAVPEGPTALPALDNGQLAWAMVPKSARAHTYS